MSQYLNSFGEPEVAIADDFDLLQAINQHSQETVYETPSFGEETSFSDAALSTSFCCDYDAVDFCGRNNINTLYSPGRAQTRKVTVFSLSLSLSVSLSLSLSLSLLLLLLLIKSPFPTYR